MKMKMSILIGVVHMNLGIIMSLFNNNYFRYERRVCTEMSHPCSALGNVGIGGRTAGGKAGLLGRGTGRCVGGGA